MASNLAKQDRDFGKMNKMAVKDRVTSAKHLKEFRKANQDVKVVPKVKDAKPAPIKVSNQNAFGRPNRPSTPIKGVICGDYEAAADVMFKEKTQQF